MRQSNSAIDRLKIGFELKAEDRLKSEGLRRWNISPIHLFTYSPIHRFSITGFTLIEVLVVIFILSILAAIVAPKIIGRTDDARIAEAKLQIKNFETALKLFKLDNGFYPSTEQGLEALITKPTTGRIPPNYRDGGYLEQKKIPLDPWGNPYIYLCPGIQGDYDIISYGADGKEGGEGKDADITNWNIQ